ncbi:Uncharacterised protein [Mycobacteroides abscessus subsp. abscessus]|nr:Uncharacterised protein [Mycobacteroides abscessus subsp. abscessus]
MTCGRNSLTTATSLAIGSSMGTRANESDGNGGSGSPCGSPEST